MRTTYKAIEVTTPGTFRAVERPLVDPGPEQIRIRVEACGVCHSDVATVEGNFPDVTYPRVPGHEVVGLVEATGSNVWLANSKFRPESDVFFSCTIRRCAN